MSKNTTWVLTEAAHRVNHGRPEILLYGRDYNNRESTECHVVTGFTPYFFVPYKEDHIQLPSGCVYDDEHIIDALGREVRKVYVDISSTVSKIRDYGWSFTDMADFLFEKRYLIDTKIKYAYTYNDISCKAAPIDVPSILLPRILYYDIEVLAPEGIMPLPIGSDYEVISIQVMDSYTEQIFVFTYKIPQTDDPTHIACNSEKELFKVFMEYISRLNPDVLTAWNSSGYDLPYLIRRSWKIGVDINKLARYGKCRCEYNPEVGDFRIKVGGRSTLDMLAAFKKFTSGQAQRESYALKSVISDTDLLGDVAFSYQDLGPILWKITSEKRYTEFIDYCKNDVIALKTIDKKVNLFIFYENIKFISGCKLDDVLFNSKIIEMLILHEGIKPMPTKKHGVISEKYQGATVITPKPGINEYMATFDLASLYPNILIAFQKSPDVDGCVVKTLEKTLAMREELRIRCKADPDNILLENQQLSIKTINNSYYGVLGLQSFRLYDKNMAEFVTSTGRELNQFLQDRAKLKGKDVIFGDSVCKDTIVKIYDVNQNWKYVKISDLFTQVDFVNGNKEYCNLNCYVESVDSNGKIILDHVPYIMRHKCNKQLYNVAITNEWSINVTEDHSLFCYINKKLKPKLQQYERLVERSPIELGKDGVKNLITRRTSIHTQVNSLNKEPLFYEYLGYHVGNGTLHYSGHNTYRAYYGGISLGDDVDVLYPYFVEGMQKLGYIENVWIDKRGGKHAGDIKYNGLEFIKFIEDHIRHSHDKRIPEFMYYESYENICAFIRGYFTADGTVSIRNNLPIVRLTSISYDLIEGMKKLLFSVGIACGYFSENVANSYNGKSSGTFSKHLIVYDVPRFKNQIGFITKRKQIKLQNCNPFKVEDDIDWSYSNKVTITPINYSDYVYDLHCKQTNRYFANDILVHNTDSIGAMPITTIDEGLSIESYLNGELARWSDERNCKVHFKLKFEKLYRRILFKADKHGEGVKKKYCGYIIWEEGKDLSDARELNYKGLELKRSDQSDITRDVLHYFLEKVLIDGDTTSAVNYVRKTYKAVMSGKIDLLTISMPKAIRKVKYGTDNPWVRGIKYAEVNYNYILNEGSKPRLIYLTCNREICIDEDFDISQIINEIDYTRMADKIVKQKMESYMWSIGYNWNKVVNGQTGFDQWC